MTTLLERRPRASILHLAGSLRAPVDSELRERVHALLAAGERRILLDLAQVSDLDAAGIGELVGVFNMARAARGSLQIAEAGRRTRRLLALTGLLRLLECRSGCCPFDETVGAQGS